MAKAPGTCISWEHISGTVFHPILRAAAAGKASFKSIVVVKNTAAMSEVSTSFVSIIEVSNSSVASNIGSLVFDNIYVNNLVPNRKNITNKIIIKIKTNFSY